MCSFIHVCASQHVVHATMYWHGDCDVDELMMAWSDAWSEHAPLRMALHDGHTVAGQARRRRRAVLEFVPSCSSSRGSGSSRGSSNRSGASSSSRRRRRR